MTTNSSELMKFVKRGAKIVNYFDYEGCPLPYRFLYSWELDDAFLNALSVINTPKVASLIAKVKLCSLSEADLVDITPAEYAEFQENAFYVDYWIVYHAIKDFQDSEFEAIGENGNPNGLNSIRNNFRYVHEIASEVLEGSKQPIEVVRELVKTQEGKIIASFHYYADVKLVSEQCEATDLQVDFLLLSHPNVERAEAIEKAHEATAITTDMPAEEYYKRTGRDVSELHNWLKKLSEHIVNNNLGPSSVG